MTIRAADGRFTIQAPQGQWDLIVAGPGFARRVVEKVGVGAGYSGRPLRIEVTHGYTIDGSVADLTSQAVSGAIITINQSPPTPSGDLLWELSRGNYLTTADSNGHFRIDGVAYLGHSGEIRASLLPGVGASLPRSLPLTDTSIRLTLLPVGAVDGTLTGAANDAFIAADSVSVPGSRLTTPVSGSGSFKFTEMPAGEYDIEIFEGSHWRKSGPRITVLPGKSITVALRVD